MSKNPITMAEVIERLFNRLHATYGAEWTRQHAGQPLNDVKTAWSHELGGYLDYLEAITHALDHLPERCPNLIQFRNVCRAAPKMAVVMLEPPKADPEKVKAALATITATKPKHDPKAWAHRIIERKAAGEYVNPAALTMARGAIA